jgi:opacity protein-like surface antigen
MKTTLLLTAAVVASTVSFANASEAKSTFGGFYVGADMGMAKQKQNKKPTVDNITYTSYLASAKTGVVYGINSGYAHTFNNYYVGIELGLLQDTSTIKYTHYTDASIKPKVSKGMTLSLNPHFGYMFGSNLVYIKAGLENTQYKFSDGVNSLKNRSTQFTPGFGYKHSFGKVFVKAEYTYVPATKINFSKNKTTLSINAKSNRFVVGLGYQF